MSNWRKPNLTKADAKMTKTQTSYNNFWKFNPQSFQSPSIQNLDWYRPSKPPSLIKIHLFLSLSLSLNEKLKKNSTYLAKSALDERWRGFVVFLLLVLVNQPSGDVKESCQVEIQCITVIKLTIYLISKSNLTIWN